MSYDGANDLTKLLERMAEAKAEALRPNLVNVRAVTRAAEQRPSFGEPAPTRGKKYRVMKGTR